MAGVRQVTREEWQAHIRQFPDRRSYRTGIVEPPQELCENDGVVVARVSYPMDGPPEYFVIDMPPKQA
jgi:hypothetical protein